MTGSAVQVTGLRQLERAIAKSNYELDLFMRSGLLALAEPVARDVRSAYAGYSARGAAGVKAKLTGSFATTGGAGNALVVQTLSKSRSLLKRRRNFGGLMMRQVFMPALDAHEAQIEAGFEALLADINERYW